MEEHLVSPMPSITDILKRMNTLRSHSNSERQKTLACEWHGGKRYVQIKVAILRRLGVLK